MNFNRKHFTYIIIIFILVVGFLTIVNWPRCSTIESVDTSIEVAVGERKSVGFDVSLDRLTFGKVSPNAMAYRAITVDHHTDANVHVIPQGDFADWILPTPKEFSIAEGEEKTVDFNVTVPEDALAGNYTGRVLFCFKE